jgi:DNA polymerase IV
MNHPLTALFIDCDGFFASVEQHLDPGLRGRAVGVVAVMAETTCCIATNYAAKAFGVKTGTSVREARIQCPGIAIVEAKPAEYIKIHHRVIAAVEDCIHVEAVLSIDEMWAWLPLNLREPAIVEETARKIKATVRREIGEAITVSIGAAPNKYLAKVASKMRKPDGFFIIQHADLPEVLHSLTLRDIHGVGRNMEARLHAAGIDTVQELCAAPRAVLHAAWGGVQGGRLWHLLRGVEIPELVSARKSIGHSHVLPPDLRAPDLAWPILCKLLHKACERLRSHGMVAGSITLNLAFYQGASWGVEINTCETDSTLRLMRLLEKLWRDRPEPRSLILQVGVVLGKLLASDNFTPPLFQVVADAMAGQDEEKHRRLDATIDRLRARYGRKVVFFGNVQEARENAPMRISFTHIPNSELEDG